MPHDLTSIINNSLLYFLNNEASEDSIYNQLLTDGHTSHLANQIVTFVPCAFGHAFLEESFSLTLPKTFCLVSTDKTTPGLLLQNEPVFCAAYTLARNAIDSGAWTTDVHSQVSLWSAEMHVINQFLHDGHSVQNARFTETCVLADIGPRRNETETSVDNKKPWWRFW